MRHRRPATPLYRLYQTDLTKGMHVNTATMIGLHDKDCDRAISGSFVSEQLFKVEWVKGFPSGARDDPSGEIDESAIVEPENLLCKVTRDLTKVCIFENS